MKIKSHFRLLCMAAVTLTFFGCKKPDTTKTDYSDSANSSSTVDNLLKDVNKTINQVASDNSISHKTDGPAGTNSTCATVTLSPNDFHTFPKTVVVDFGTGCTDPNDGVTRKGKYTAVFSNYLNHGGSNVTVTFQDYYVNGVHLEGNYSLTNTNAAGNNTSPYSFTDQVTNAKATLTDGTYATWNATRTSTQTGGVSTAYDWTDDEYTISGTSSGVGFKGSSFSTTSTNVLYKLDCRYLVSGTTTIYSGSDHTPIVVDYGNGDCDNKYHVTYGIYAIDLNFWY